MLLYAALPAFRRHLPEFLLIGVTMVWGATFVLVKDAVSVYPTLPFLAIRFSIAAFLMAALIPLVRRVPWRSARATEPASFGAALPPTLAEEMETEVRPRRRRGLLFAGTLMGIFLSAGYVFQTLGLEVTTASNAGFITGMFVVLVPLLELLLWRRWVGGRALIGATIAFAGLVLLSGGAGAGELRGDLLVFLCALGFAAHILATARYAANHDPLILNALQLGMVALVTTALTLAAWGTGSLTDLGWPRDGQVWWALGITAVFASTLAFLIQTFAQRYAPPTRTALILTLEPVFAGAFGFALAGERLSLAGWVGAILIMTGILLAEFRREGGRKQTAREVSPGPVPIRDP